MTSTVIDTTRHDRVFDRLRFGQRPVGVVGAGAVGSWTVLNLAQLGVENITVFDFDHVEGHNLANQFYFPGDIGKLKVEALRDNVLSKTGIEIAVCPEKIEAKRQLGEIVFVAVDSMQARKTIWETCIRRNPMVKLMIETRMGVDEYRIYRVRPTNRNEISGWEASYYDDDEVAPAEVGVCNAQITVGTTAMMLGAHAAHQLVVWFQRETGADMPVEHEQVVTLCPFAASFTTSFESPAARSAA